ncbi:pyridoxamine 5'-phosphate oxidase family protein [Mucilaginibacter sp. UR6-1]|uniref:pyridoxamine 5'-phosphate oxidase family protein n=1 Tax=Mucilaginibacter sp. UR6-1 TaxID=1435643 RepID=UPI001E3E1E18|nr:pyridoxamine 5'-phosphate oxidase family protein [Mucilaginibacter sp. UR6-1]MCC8407658.1 pyridoxamine 5'-phosphate oxidase family protein [Mucilaginibacter sp. UR6-1]
MLGELTQIQAVELLTKHLTGRLGCHADGVTYVVPVNYVFKDNTIYSHSASGKKIDMMRKNPDVCFEVDELQSIFKWKSVIAWGRFVEISDIAEKQQVMQSIIHRIMPLVTTPHGHPSHGITDHESDIGDKVELVIYKIVIDKITGRFEN